MNDDHWLDLAEEAGQLREALASRGPIEQAKGIILIMCCTTADEAYGWLRRESMHHNVKLATLAEAIVDVCSNPSPIFCQRVEPTKAHIVAFDLLEEWGMDFGHMPTTGMERQSAPTQRDSESAQAAEIPGRSQ